MPKYLLLALLPLCTAVSLASTGFRPPAVPLVACDPYFSIWSPGDRLTDEATRHWTGKPHRLTSSIKVDGREFRLMGTSPEALPALKQTSVVVMPTRTIYQFEDAGIALTFTFTTPALPGDLDLLSRPITYLTWEARSTDQADHRVHLSFGASAELAVNTGEQLVDAEHVNVSGLRTLRAGSQEQSVLGKRGDDLRIDWGYFYVAVSESQTASLLIKTMGSAEVSPQLNQKVSGRGDSVQLCAELDFGRVGKASVSRWLMLAYDDLYSIRYMGRDLRPYWRRHGWEAADLLKAAKKDYERLTRRCVEFDRELMADLVKAGGERYAEIAALAYRQCFAAGKIVADDKGQPLQFCKENFSNGCIATSDVFYPMSPQFLLFGPSLAKAFLVPFMNYAASERWKFPFAPHDLGTYPHANGQVYGGGERTEVNQMPVEETGNLLILLCAVAEMEGNPSFAKQYWPLLEKWAEYLKAKGFDPENQLCTDDFAGHLAHNVNLSAKAICGLGSFARLCEMAGNKSAAESYAKLARGFAERWVKEATDGDHFRLAFDRPGTWSQKYNLVWDKILGLDLFPDQVRRTEMVFYRRTQNQFGLPLDNRQAYTKLDWTVWTATLTRDREDFNALVDPIWDFLNQTPDRIPMTDWYWTQNARHRGFQARPVVGGVFLPLLYEGSTWKKWAKQDRTKAAHWAPIPPRPKQVTLVPAADESSQIWRFTETAPADDWFQARFDDSTWKTGQSGFGTEGTPGAIIRTRWASPDIWLRRRVEFSTRGPGEVQLWMHHDENVEVYVNGVLAAKATGYTSTYEPVVLNRAGQAALRTGTNVIAIHCHQTSGGQYIDAGLIRLESR